MAQSMLRAHDLKIFSFFIACASLAQTSNLWTYQPGKFHLGHQSLYIPRFGLTTVSQILHNYAGKGQQFQKKGLLGSANSPDVIGRGERLNNKIPPSTVEAPALLGLLVEGGDVAAADGAKQSEGARAC